ncbi:TonB-dependent hemoglobin/transferrin/lactoferrin family receptor [Brucella sp. BE17]|uniref:TonB-dependent hemoglobin/transferrin/lactoferrin family receptor n=1 Tax=Brucella sp. BE17 TaxID=3142977 RepID=UPI0031B9E1DE
MRATGGQYKRSFLASSGLAIILVAMTSQSFAQEQKASESEDGVNLKTVVIKGVRTSKGSVTDTPLASTTTADQISKQDINTLKDIGNTTEPGVAVNSTTGSVNIRGLEGNRVLTTIDGIAIPYLEAYVRSAVSGGSDAYDLSSLSTFDVLYGADASRVGGGAMGGALALKTLEPADLLAPGKAFGGIAKLTYDGSDKSFIGSAAVAQKIQNTSVLFQGSYKRGHEVQNTGDVGGYGSARTEANPRDYDRSNLMFKLRQELEGGHTVGLTAERNRLDADTDKYSDAGTTYDNKTLRDNQQNKRDRISLDYRYEAQSEDALVNNAFATLYWQRIERSYETNGTRISSLRGPYSRKYNLEEERYGATGYTNLDFDTGTLSHSLTIGGDVSFSKYKQQLTGADNCTRGTATPMEQMFVCPYLHINQKDTPDVDATRFGMFVEDRIEIGDTPFAITPGIRYDWYKFKPDSESGYADSTGNRFSPKIRASWQAMPELELFAQFSTTYKSPEIDQLYVTYLSATYGTIGNPDLDPETGYGFDIGANFGNQNTGGRITAFVNRYSSFIDTITTRTDDYPDGLTTFRNLNKARIAGIELKAHHYFNNGINIHGAVSYAKAMNLDDNIPLSSSQPLKGVVGVGYDTENWGADASVVMAGYLNQTISTRSGMSSRRLPGYGIVNLTGWWEPEQIKGMRLQAGVYNLFDKQYYNAMEVNSVSNVTEFYSEAGRNFKISLTQKF